MKGLILKDLLNLKRYVRIVALLFVVYAVFFSLVDNGNGLGAMFALLGSMLVITTMSYDDLAKWDGYALAMPLSRRDVVLGKYLVMLLLCLAGAAVGALFDLLIGLFHHNLAVGEVALSSGLILCVALALNSLALPLLYKFGAEKARILLILCYLAPVILILGLGKLLPNSQQSVQWIHDLFVKAPLLGFGMAAVLALGVVCISYGCSLAIYSKKDI
jgi:ABC-2 type transport system permease protein